MSEGNRARYPALFGAPVSGIVERSGTHRTIPPPPRPGDHGLTLDFDELAFAQLAEEIDALDAGWISESPEQSRETLPCRAGERPSELPTIPAPRIEAS